MKKIALTVLSFALPIAVAAQTTIESIIGTIRRMVDTIIPLFMVVAVAIFLWGIVKYITASGDEEKAKSARGYIIYGLIGLFVMVAFWGIIRIVAETFGVQQGGTVPLPSINP